MIPKRSAVPFISATFEAFLLWKDPPVRHVRQLDMQVSHKPPPVCLLSNDLIFLPLFFVTQVEASHLCFM